jgi:hypothetical protein
MERQRRKPFPGVLAGVRGRLRKLGWCAHFIGGAVPEI